MLLNALPSPGAMKNSSVFNFLPFNQLVPALFIVLMKGIFDNVATDHPRSGGLPM